MTDGGPGAHASRPTLGPRDGRAVAAVCGGAQGPAEPRDLAIHCVGLVQKLGQRRPAGYQGNRAGSAQPGGLQRRDIGAGRPDHRGGLWHVGHAFKAYGSMSDPPLIHHVYSQPGTAEYDALHRRFHQQHLGWFLYFRACGKTHVPRFEKPGTVSKQTNVLIAKALERPIPEHTNGKAG